MRRFDWLRERYEHVGYSNHVPDPAPMLYAVSRGAEIVETHFKLADSGKGRAAPFDVSLDTLKSVCEFRDRVAVLRGSRECLEEDFLLPEEVKARERFIGRFGDNR
jgi:sialic acid synthase SpsE